MRPPCLAFQTTTLLPGLSTQPCGSLMRHWCCALFHQWCATAMTEAGTLSASAPTSRLATGARLNPALDPPDQCGNAADKHQQKTNREQRKKLPQDSIRID